MDTNNLLLTIEEFSRIACLDGHLFGVDTACDRCNTRVNACIGRNVREKLREIQEVTERRVGYNLTSRYHVQHIRWNGEETRYQLDWPGVSEVNVVSGSRLVGTASVNPFSIEGVTITYNLTANCCIAEVPRALVNNPAHALFRNATTGSRILPLSLNGYPKLIDGNWHIPLDNGYLPPCEGGAVNVQHCNMIAITPPIYDGSGEMVACYPDTDTIIPHVKVVDGVYWFMAWSLVDPVFYEEQTDLGAGDLYKLLPSVDFRVFFSEESQPQALNDVGAYGDTDYNEWGVEPEVQIEVIDAELGIVYLKPLSYTIREQATFLTVFYRTDPETAGVLDQLPALKDGIAYLVAAELPLEACGCQNNDEASFLKTARTPYHKIVINPLSGMQLINQEFGDLYGQRVFAAKLERARKIRRLILL